MKIESKQHALLILALAKAWKTDTKKRVEDAENEAKHYLLTHAEWTGGDSAKARIGTTDIGSVALQTGKRTLTVTDEEAFAMWRIDHGYEPHWETHLAAYEVAPTLLASLIESHGGEIPDGVTASFGDDYFVVRQTEAHRGALHANMDALAHLLSEMHLQIGGGSDE